MDPSLIETLKTILSGGPALIFAYMWYLERKERIALSEKLIQTLTNMGEMNEAWLRVLKTGDSGSRGGRN